MTDRETIIAMAERANVRWEETPEHVFLYGEAGYMGFFSVLEFDSQGRLTDVGGGE